MRVLRGRAQHLTELERDADPRYQAILQRVGARGRFGIRLGLGRTRALLRSLGDPHLALRGALIGGTNGKGSTQALVAAALREGGLRVGQTPKPHLQTYRERLVVDGRLIDVDQFSDLFEEVLAHADALDGRVGPPTEFEVVTAAAFTWFARSGVDVAVIEVGLGGRLDATNVWQGGVSAITNVGLDHMEHLGPTVEAIAKEKAAIIKRGDWAAITGATGAALEVVRRRARAVGVTLEPRAPWQVIRVDRTGTLARTDADIDHRIGLLGRHQAANAAVAMGILAALNAGGIASVSVESIQRGFAATRWPGRMELVSRRGQPTVLLDGAHNPDGMSALGTTLVELLPQIAGGSPTVLLGILANHWQEGMLDPLVEPLRGAALIATRVPGSPSSLDPGRLAATWGAGAVAIADPRRAFDSALDRASRAGGPLVVCGSLYLVGYARTMLDLGPGSD